MVKKNLENASEHARLLGTSESERVQLDLLSMSLDDNFSKKFCLFKQNKNHFLQTMLAIQLCKIISTYLGLVSFVFWC